MAQQHKIDLSGSTDNFYLSKSAYDLIQDGDGDPMKCKIDLIKKPVFVQNFDTFNPESLQLEIGGMAPVYTGSHVVTPDGEDTTLNWSGYVQRLYDRSYTLVIIGSGAYLEQESKIYTRSFKNNIWYGWTEIISKNYLKKVMNSLKNRVGDSKGNLIANHLTVGKRLENTSLGYGDYSFAQGLNNIASGYYSHAEGYNTEASGTSTHAEGYWTTSSGYYSHAEGCNTDAAGKASHTEGEKTSAYGDYSHAEGYRTQAEKHGAHAEGHGSKALGDNTHAEGYQAEASGDCTHAEGYQTKTSGFCSHAEGYQTISAEGGQNEQNMYCTHAEGYMTRATGQRGAHSEGNYTKAKGLASHAEGGDTLASAEYSHASGFNTTAASSAQTTVGKYNTRSTAAGLISGNSGDAFIVGCGTNTSATKNALRVSYGGNCYGQNNFVASGVGYAEYSEWEDNNLLNEDRIGIFVSWADTPEKIRVANSSDRKEDIVGVVSGNPCVIGNGDENYYHQYLRDDFHRLIKEEFEEAVKEEKVIFDENGKPVIDEETGLPKFEIIETGEVIKNWRYVTSPDYDPQKLYIERKDRPEWATIAWIGQVPVRDNGECKVGGLCKPNDKGIAVPSTRKNNVRFRVINRITDNVILIAVK